MAHEALKFNVICNDVTNLQPICGSVDFHTFHMVYMKIKKLHETQEDTITKYYYDVEFYLQNYDGDITIGFEGKPILKELDALQIENRRKELIKSIRGFNNLPQEEQERLLRMHHVDFVLDIGIKAFDMTHSLKNIQLGPISKPFNGCILETNIERKTMDSTLYRQTDPLNSKYINPNHYKRAGDEILEVGFRNMNSTGPFNHQLGVGTLLSRCNPSRSFLI